MQQDGARLTKLKEVFKRAIQEILKEEDNINTMLKSPGFKDSFYSESTVNMAPEDIKHLFSEVKSRFTEHFKTKIRQTNLDFKLNNIDKDIKNGRASYKDIKNNEYIKEIFESNIVDKKEELVELLEKENNEAEMEIGQLKQKSMQMEAEIQELQQQNIKYELEYQELIKQIESVFDD